MCSSCGGCFEQAGRSHDSTFSVIIPCRAHTRPSFFRPEGARSLPGLFKPWYGPHHSPRPAGRTRSARHRSIGEKRATLVGGSSALRAGIRWSTCPGFENPGNIRAPSGRGRSQKAQRALHPIRDRTAHYERRGSIFTTRSTSRRWAPTKSRQMSSIRSLRSRRSRRICFRSFRICW